MRTTRLLAGLCLFATSANAADIDAMGKDVSGFYAAYRTFHPSDGIPDAKSRAKYAPYISAGLNGLLAKGDAAEGKFAAANKDSPPLIEGDLFTSNFEGATTIQIGACAGDGKTGHCAVNLAYDPGKTGNPKDKPFHWTDTAYLVNEAGGWRVDDIAYGANEDFGNKGRMRDTLKMAIADAGN
jgi:hypothetical protein